MASKTYTVSFTLRTSTSYTDGTTVYSYAKGQYTEKTLEDAKDMWHDLQLDDAYAGLKRNF